MCSTSSLNLWLIQLWMILHKWDHLKVRETNIWICILKYARMYLSIKRQSKLFKRDFSQEFKRDFSQEFKRSSCVDWYLMVVILELCRCTFNLNSSSKPQYWSDQRINVYSKLPTVSFIEFFLMLIFYCCFCINWTWQIRHQKRTASFITISWYHCNGRSRKQWDWVDPITIKFTITLGP